MSDAGRADLALRAISMIDLTDLADDHAPDGIAGLCDRAARHKTAAVCVWPEFVADCAERLSNSGVRVATVVNFPSGDDPVADVVELTEWALAAGADDIDLVLPYHAFLAGDDEIAAAMIDDVAALVGSERVLKVILETGVLRDPEVIGAAAALAVQHGADFLKTSTGKVAGGASLEAASAMLRVIAASAADGRSVGLKPSGGIRTFDDAVAYLDLADSVMGEGWATPATFRFGASGLLDTLLAELDDTTLAASPEPGSIPDY
jgi:deoxyribose-phosphate aldolase